MRRTTASTLALIAMGLLAPGLSIRPAAGQTAPLPIPPSPPAAASWPHMLTRSGATLTFYQPQAVSWPDRKTLTAGAAADNTPPVIFTASRRTSLVVFDGAAALSARGGRLQGSGSSALGAGAPRSARPGTLGGANYQQLQRDRLGREAGGGGFSGGGRFRR